MVENGKKNDMVQAMPKSKGTNFLHFLHILSFAYSLRPPSAITTKAEKYKHFQKLYEPPDAHFANFET